MGIRELNEIHLITDVLRHHPRGEETLRRYFGEDFLKRKSMTILSLRLACVLWGVSPTDLMKDLHASSRGKGVELP